MQHQNNQEVSPLAPSIHEMNYRVAMTVVENLRKENDELKAARFAYASEFGFDEDGQPDTGSIHQNIRALKAEREKVRVPDGWKLVPVDATQVMRDAGNKTLQTLATEPGMGIADRAFYVWCAMLTASPTPPHADQKGQ